MLSRREFMKMTSLIALTPAVPTFIARAARAATWRRDGSDGRILVVLHLAGGNDALNTLVPFADERYATFRKTLAQPRDRLLRIDDNVALHPAMTAMKTLYDRGQLALVQGVGYPNPNRSHDVSTAIWNTARFDREEHGDCGWLGRACDAAPPLSPGTPASILVGPDALPIALKARKAPAVAIDEFDDVLKIDLDWIGGTVAPARHDDSVTDFVERTTLDACVTARKLKDAAARASSGAKYPASDLARRLRLVAQLIETGFETPVYYALHRGYDTHTAQLETQATLLRDLSTALLSFFDDLAEAKVADRVVVVVFSEFGRRLQENASAGTDHGTAGVVFVVGARVRGGLHGRAPDLGDLDAEGDPRPTVDFRSVYAEMLRNWLRVPDEPSLGGTFAPLPLLAV